MPDARLRVALVYGDAPAHLDGVRDYVEHLVAALPAAGVDPVPVPLPGAGGWAGLHRAARRIRAARPDVVHVQFAPSAYGYSRLPGLLPYLVGRRVPVVTTLHEYGEAPARGWCWVERAGLWDRDTGRLVPASRLLIVTNAGHQRAVCRRTGRPAVRIPLAANVEARPPDPLARRRTRDRLGLPADVPVLVFFGFVHPVKGLRYLIEALPALRRRHPGLRLLVVGGLASQALPGPEAEAVRAELDELGRQLGVADATTFTGHLPAPAVSRALAAADVAVLPFTAGVTAKSGALLALQAHRLPVVVTRPDPPDPELVDGDTVVHAARRRDPGALVAAVHRVLADPALATQVAARGAARSAGRGWPAVATAHRAAYAQLRR